jgi:hypothetical protein
MRGAMHRSVETPQAFLVFTSSQIVQVVPKRAFAQEDLSRIQRMLRERIPPRPAVNQWFEKRTVILWLLLIVFFITIWFLRSAH